MKHMLRVYLSSLISLWIVSMVYPPFALPQKLTMILEASLVYSLLRLFVEPLITILFLPIQFLTLGFLSWVRHVVLFYVLTLLVPTIMIRQWTFPEISWIGFVVPSIHISYFIALTSSSIFVTILYRLAQWLYE